MTKERIAAGHPENALKTDHVDMISSPLGRDAMRPVWERVFFPNFQN